MDVISGATREGQFQDVTRMILEECRACKSQSILKQVFSILPLPVLSGSSHMCHWCSKWAKIILKSCQNVATSKKSLCPFRFADIPCSLCGPQWSPTKCPWEHISTERRSRHRKQACTFYLDAAGNVYYGLQSWELQLHTRKEKNDADLDRKYI